MGSEMPMEEQPDLSMDAAIQQQADEMDKQYGKDTKEAEL